MTDGLPKPRSSPPPPKRSIVPPPSPSGRTASPISTPGRGPVRRGLAPSSAPVTRIGIDFGTSSTLISVGEDASPAPRLVRLGDGGIKIEMPSEIAFEPDGSILIGDDAAGASPRAIVARSVKRCFSCPPKGCRHATSCWSRGTGRLDVAGVTHTLDNVVMRVVEHALKIAQAHSSFNSSSILVRIGCPVEFDRKKREALLDPMRYAVGQAELTLNNVTNESNAAAVAFARREGIDVSASNGLLLIVDFGGGSLDTALVSVEQRARERIIITVADAGNNALGGDDVDGEVYSWLLRQLSNEWCIKVDDVRVAFDADYAAQWYVRGVARRGKEQLWHRSTARITLLPERLPVGLASDRLDVDLDLATLNELAEPVLDRMLEVLIRLFRKGGLLSPTQADCHTPKERMAAMRQHAAPHIGQVVLVGGTSRLSCVRSIVSDIFGKDRIAGERILDPVQAVAIGLGYGSGHQTSEMWPLPTTVLLRVYDEEGHAKDYDLYRAYESTYEWHQTVAGRRLEIEKEVTITGTPHRAEIVLCSPSREPYEVAAIKSPRGLTVTVWIDARTTLFRMSEGNTCLYETYLTEFGRRHGEREREERERVREEENRKERERQKHESQLGHLSVFLEN